MGDFQVLIHLSPVKLKEHLFYALLSRLKTKEDRESDLEDANLTEQIPTTQRSFL